LNFGDYNLGFELESKNSWAVEPELSFWPKLWRKQAAASCSSWSHCHQLHIMWLAV